MKNRIASIGTITAALALSVACSNGSASNFEQPTSVASTVTARQGNDRGNGGNSIPRKSNLLQVQSMLQKIQEKAVENETCDFYDFGNDWKFAKKAAHQAAIHDASLNACRILQELVRDKRILIQATECKDGHSGAARDGSVSEPSLKGTVCISTDRLQAIPPSELKEQIQGLLLHEIMHLLGYAEDLAVYVQEYYLRDVASAEYWSSINGNTPLRARAEISQYPKPAEIQRSLEKDILEFERNREYFSHFGIPCTDASGVAHTWKSLHDLLVQPDSLKKLGLPTDINNFNQADIVALNSLRLRVQAIVWGPSKYIPQFPDLSNDPLWIAKFKVIENVVKATSDQFELAYPASKAQLSVCEESLIRGRATLRLRLEEERYRIIQEQLAFD